MNKNVRIWLILGTLIVVTLLAAVWAASTLWFPPAGPFEPRERPPIQYDIEIFYDVETVVSVINVTLSAFLLLAYVSIYRRTRSEFTVGLMILSAVLLLHAFVSIPLVHRVFGFTEFGLGPFVMLPDLFTCLALAVLLYLTFKY